MRKLLFAVALFLAIFIVNTRFAEVQSIAETLQQGDWRFMLIALGVEALWLLNIAVTYRVIFHATGLQERTEKLLLMSAAANFVNIVAPSAGVGGMAVFIAEARRMGYSSGRVTIAGVLFVLYDYAGFLCILTIGLFVLMRRNTLNAPELIASIVLIIIAMGMASLLLLGMRSARELGNVLAWIARLVNKVLRPIIHREYLSETRAHTFAHDAADGLHELRQNPKKLFPPIGYALVNKSLLVLILTLMFLAFKVPVSLGTVIAGFSIGYLFLIVSPTPAGLGVVEGALTLALSSLYVPLEAAAVITLGYRGITFWVPLVFGLVAFRFWSHGEKLEANY